MLKSGSGRIFMVAGVLGGPTGAFYDNKTAGFLLAFVFNASGPFLVLRQFHGLVKK
jgi:hypothetical protein